MTRVIAGVPHVAGVTVARAAIPVGVAGGVGGAGVRVLAGGLALTPRHHAVLQLGAEVSIRVSADPNILKQNPYI